MLVIFATLLAVLMVVGLSTSLVVTKKRYKPVKGVTLDLLEDDGEDVKFSEWWDYKYIALFSIVVVGGLGLLVQLPKLGIVTRNLQLYYMYTPLILFAGVGSLISVYTDTKYAVISNFFTYSGMCIAILTNLSLMFSQVYLNDIINIGYMNLTTGVLIFVTLQVCQLIFRKKIGGGDIKFMIMVAFILPATVMPSFLMIACGIMLLGFMLRAIVSYIRTKNLRLRDPLQFAIPLTISLWVHLIGFIIFNHC